MSAIATDADELDFLTYWLVGGEGIFSIEPNTGVVSVNRVKLDYRGVYKMTVFVRDSAIPPATSRANVTITVNSTIQVVPKFGQLGYDITVEEKEPVSSIIADIVVTNKVNCLFEIIDGNSNDAFGISPSGHIFITRALDFEAVRYYTLTISARDLDDITLTSDVKVRVTVLDSNDNEPEFSPNPNQIHVYLPVTPYKVIFQFFAHDDDSMRNDNNKIRFDLLNFEDKFIMDPESGELSSRPTLTTGSFNISVSATNPDSAPRLMAVTHMEILVAETNRNVPKFVQEYIVISFNESYNVPRLLVNMDAQTDGRDMDLGVVYELVGGFHDNKFLVNRNNVSTSCVR
jgi:hypothetical protein